MSKTNDYSWIQAGADAFVLYGRHDSVQKVQIVKVGKRDVVLDNGTKFNLTYKDGHGRLFKRGGGAWDPHSHLCSPDDRQILRLLDEQKIATYLSQAEKSVSLARRGKEGRLQHIEDARRHLLNALDQQAKIDLEESTS